MARWQDMVHIKTLRRWAEQTNHDIAFPCAHCRQATSLMQCAYTAPTWADDGTQAPGGLACPHCGQDTARAALRSYARMDAAARRDAEDDRADEEDDDEQE
jgi:hypothetical protein